MDERIQVLSGQGKGHQNQMGPRLGSLLSQGGAECDTFLCEFWEVAWRNSSRKGRTAKAAWPLAKPWC